MALNGLFDNGMHNFTASLFNFCASERGKLGLNAHTPCNFLNITEIFLHWKDY